MPTNSINGVIRSVRMPFSHMSKAGRIVMALFFLAAGMSTFYVGLTADYPAIIVGAVLLCFIGVILTSPERKRR